MKLTNPLFAGTALAVLLAAAPSRGDLLLTGRTAGSFEGPDTGYNVITNAPDGPSASLRTGVPIGASFQSGVVFESNGFSAVQNGDTFAFGMITYYNGVTMAGTSSAEAMFDFYLDLEDPALGLVKLTTITFGIDATLNTPDGLVPDFFTASFAQPDPLLIDGQWVKFTINDLPGITQVDEQTWVQLANVSVSVFTPVPEPSVYGLAGALGVLTLAIRRRRRTSASAA